MDGQERRQEIMRQLAGVQKPVSASKFAQQFGVSRQIIVGDIALLRAAGEEIVATARGYLLEQHPQGYTSKIAVQHDASQTEEELLTIVQYGGEVIDVVVEHPLYGELVGGLHIQTPQEVQQFMIHCQNAQASLLSQLTGGIHLHTIRYNEPTDLDNIKAALEQKGILYKEPD